MINSERIVPITKVDLLSLYSAVLAVGNVNFDVAESNTVDGDFEVKTNSKTYLCNQPVKTFDFGSSVSASTVYFIPAHNYEGFTKNGAAVTTTGDVETDGATLHKAVLASGSVTITKIGA